MMTMTVLIWILAVVAAGGGAALFTMGYYCGREDTADPRRWERGAHPYAGPLAEDGDFDDFLDGLLAPGPDLRERLADTSELAALYDGNYPVWKARDDESAA